MIGAMLSGAALIALVTEHPNITAVLLIGVLIYYSVFETDTP